VGRPAPPVEREEEANEALEVGQQGEGGRRAMEKGGEGARGIEVGLVSRVESVHRFNLSHIFLRFPRRLGLSGPFDKVLQSLPNAATVEDLFHMPFLFSFNDNGSWGWQILDRRRQEGVGRLWKV